MYFYEKSLENTIFDGLKVDMIFKNSNLKNIIAQGGINRATIYIHS